ncbi:MULTISPECIES: ABC transporter ATP-binding protein [Cellulomonas]|uniref:ABC transporter ATP-binding protein n=1 Tax=Cellulomonas TaxID=1707 RepID=UPI0006257713|nr:MULTISPECIES: ATP-binding cassette domain-containing protein [Cellulomonas]
MTPSATLEAHALTKRYRRTTAVDDLSFRVRPGVVTGFLGPNGAGKSTTLRLFLGLDRPTRGAATVGGLRLAETPRAMRVVGAMLDARAVHPRRTATDHLLAVARAGGVHRRRVPEVLGLVGLADAAHRPAGELSLGMQQRLGIATALVGDPGVVILDEPLNGLDPEGIRWARTLMRDLAREGRTVLFSSHLMGEMELTADHLVVVHHGRLLADQLLTAFVAERTTRRVRARSPERARLAAALDRAGVTTRVDPVVADALDVTGTTTDEVGRVAATAGVALAELTDVRDSLEEVFLAMTAARKDAA